MNTRSRGVALVIVLSFLVLISALIIAFFSSVTTEFSAAKTYSDGITSRQLADSAVNMVMGQIREATATRNAAWASQPGMIRTYRNGQQAGGNLDAFYKLYSSDEMILSGTDAASKQFDPSNDVAEEWYKKPAQYVDLNQPVRVLNPDTSAAEKYIYRYPIMDPGYSKSFLTQTGGSADLAIDGFDIDYDSGADTRTNLTINEKIGRMPTQWLYVLRDGTITSPNVTTANDHVSWDASAKPAKTPTKENPIVGRVAFWADDETSKVNLNTAGGFSLKDVKDYSESDYPGSYWDTPRTQTRFELGNIDTNTGLFVGAGGGLALCQPLSGEFQRYPGHPSTTSLGVVFKNFLNSEQLYKLTPRLFGGAQLSSMGGTVRQLSTSAAPISRKRERLYSSVDELLFAEGIPKDSNNPGDLQYLDNKGNRYTNDELTTINNVVTPALLEKTRFFLTAHSRAPELNLFGRPRITIWPEHTNTTYRNTADRLIAFCSTIGPESSDPNAPTKSFYFQRNSPYSSTNDYSGIPRNRALYKYLQGVTGQRVPGYKSTASFQTKYGNDRDQILTEIFDYIRTVNLRDSTRDKTLSASDKDKYKYAPRGLVVPIQIRSNARTTRGFGRFPTISEASIVLYHAGYRGSDGVPYTYLGTAENGKPVPKPGVKVVANFVKAFLIFEFFNPMQGYAPVNSPYDGSTATAADGLEISVTGMSQFALDAGSGAQPLGFPGSGVNLMRYSSASAWDGRNSGGSEGFAHAMILKDVPEVAATGGHTQYQFQTDPAGSGVEVPVPPADINGNVPLDQQITLIGARLNISMTYKTKVSGITPIRNFEITFPNAPVLVPTDEIWLSTTSGPLPDQGGMTRVPSKPGWACNHVDPTAVKRLSGRIAWFLGGPSGDYTNQVPPGEHHGNRVRQILQPGDTVRSMIVAPTADFRIAAMTDTGDLYTAHPDYQNATVRQAQTLRRATGAPYFAGVAARNFIPGVTTPTTRTLSTNFGNLVELTGTSATYPSAQAADIPLTNTTVHGVKHVGNIAAGQPGDFDTGIGGLADGAYTGKADEGNLAYKYYDGYAKKYVYVYPYFTFAYEEAFDTFFTPNRQVPSAVVFGSLSAGRLRHWQTLAFSPNPAALKHPGITVEPKDHLLLDLFHMPIVEPYAISEPFSTAGKVNLNYPIAPFGWIHRTTALRAALQSVRISAIPIADVARYKTSMNTFSPATNYRKLLNANETIKSFDLKFSKYSASSPELGFFKSASEICEQYLYPKFSSADKSAYPNGEPTAASGENAIKTFWQKNTLTGDNLREKPYGDLYPRLTTKSNTYTVHMCVQTLRKRPPVSATVTDHYSRWDEGKDQVMSEYRGSAVIERYINPEDRRFDDKDPETILRQDYIDVDSTVDDGNPKHASLENVYHFRVLNVKRFLP